MTELGTVLSSIIVRTVTSHCTHEGILQFGCISVIISSVVIDCRAFHAEVPGLLRKGGIYSFFNGLAADNAFFHTVCCHVVQAELVR